MDVQQLLHMNSGEGKQSYANNSFAQSSLMARTKPYIEEALLQVFSIMKPQKLINIADLGCSSGPSALLAVDMIVNVVNRQNTGIDPCAELHAFLNDLPGNDFNNIFKSIPSFYRKIREGEDRSTGLKCFISATPGSFYGRLFPRKSLHFVYSANSRHWLSQVPPELTGKNGNLNKGNVCVGKTSPLIVFEAYSAQFHGDFTAFLKSRSEEIVPGGCMVLSLAGRNTLNHSSEECEPLFWPALAYALEELIKEGVVEEEKVDSFNIPLHEAHIEELREIIQDDGSFEIIQLEEIPYDGHNFGTKLSPDLMTNSVRAITEPLLTIHFGEAVMNRLFDKYKEKFPLNYASKAVALVVSLARKA